MKLCGISDMHGKLDFNIEKSDILCIAGDILPLNAQMSSKKSEKWIKNTFIPWCNTQNVEEIYLIGGNHDFYLYRHADKLKEMLKDTKIKYLCDEFATYTDENGKDYIIYGSPWCHQFGDWAFMGYSDEELEKIFLKMPDNVDVLVTHDAPYGVSDVCLQNDAYWVTPDHIGNKGLAAAIKEKQPKINLHGHLHSTNHDVETLDDTKVYNVSVVDERYDLSYKPLYLELKKD